jgi:hypothetical protein
MKTACWELYVNKEADLGTTGSVLGGTTGKILGGVLGNQFLIDG